MKEQSVFISHSSKDRPYIDELIEMLKKMGITYWVAPDMIEAGMSYAQMIPRAIGGCEVFLVLLSEYSQKSIWVEKEVDSAIYYKKKIIPLQIDDAPMTDAFRFYLNNVQIIYAVGRKEDAFSELETCLRKLVKESGGQPQPVIERVKEAKQLPQKAPDGQKTPAEAFVKKTEKQKNGPERDGEKKGRYMQWETERRRRMNILDDRGAPLECQYCGGNLEETLRGVFLCKECGEENYDYFRKVKNYLSDYGAHSVFDIEKNTGVPRKSIMHLLNEGLFSAPQLSSKHMVCSKCGMPIPAGILCDRCKTFAGETFGSSGKMRFVRKK